MVGADGFVIDSEQIGLKEPHIKGYEAGIDVLGNEADNLTAIISVLEEIERGSSEPSFEAGAFNEALGSIISYPEGDESAPAVSANQLLGFLTSIYKEFVPEQQDPNANTTRWTMNWKELGRVFNEKIGERAEEIEGLIVTNFPTLVETGFPSEKNGRTLEFVTGGANAQPLARPTLLLAGLATEEFRQENGLIALNPGQDINGVDSQAPGWMMDISKGGIIEKLRAHVQERIQQGEIAPIILVGGSGANARLLGETELEKMCTLGIFDRNNMPEPLFPNRGITEADAMLAGSRIVFGAKSASSISKLHNISNESVPDNLLIDFESDLGKIHVIATTGTQANMYDQIRLALNSEVFSNIGIQNLHGYTTAIYTVSQRMALAENARIAGLSGEVEMLGMSAHAWGVERKLHTLVGELATCIRALYSVAERAIKHAEANTQIDTKIFNY